MTESIFSRATPSESFSFNRRTGSAPQVMIDRAKANPKVNLSRPTLRGKFLLHQGFVEGVRLRIWRRKRRAKSLSPVSSCHRPHSQHHYLKGKSRWMADGYLLAQHGSLTKYPAFS